MISTSVSPLFAIRRSVSSMRSIPSGIVRIRPYAHSKKSISSLYVEKLVSSICATMRSRRRYIIWSKNDRTWTWRSRSVSMIDWVVGISRETRELIQASMSVSSTRESV